MKSGSKCRIKKSDKGEFMTFYQELQLNQAGSKALIKASKSKKEKYRHIAVYLFKILLTVAFCTAFVMAFGAVFGEDNNIVGVVMLLCVLLKIRMPCGHLQ